MNPLIDIGCNLSSSRLYPHHDQIIARAHRAGVSQLILTGTDPQSNEVSLELAHRYDGIYCTAGHHPHHANAWNPFHHPILIQMMAQDPKVVAIGEMGLDYCRNFSTPIMQKRCFTDQLEVAVELQKPIFLHEREAFDDFIHILKPYLPQITNAVWHCFTGSQQQLKQVLDLGLYIGITGWICDPIRGQALKEVVKYIPDDRIMIETDAPYLTPKTLSPIPKINEPQYLPEVLRVLAACQEKPIEKLAQQTTQNAKRFFSILPTHPVI